MSARASVAAAVLGVLALTVCASASAQSKVPPLASPPSLAWVSVRVTGAPSPALVAARAELERLIVARPDLRLGTPGAGGVRAYEIELSVSSPRSSPSGVLLSVELRLTEASTGRSIASSSVHASGGMTGPRPSVLDVVRAGWPRISLQILP